MSNRERLMELLRGDLPHFKNDLVAWHDVHLGELADHLLANGVMEIKIVPKVIRHFELNESFNDDMTCFTKKIISTVADMQDKAIVQAVVSYAQREGFTDLYLLDEEFVKTALINEAKRRKEGAE